MENKQEISIVKKWMIASRPFALPASTMPVIFGTVLAVVIGGAKLNIGLFVLSLLAMVILHSASNILSDIKDFEKGLDVEPTPVSGAVVRKLITPKEAMKAAVILFVIGGALGLLIAWLTVPGLLIIGGVGLLIGIGYTFGGPLALKYHGLGDFAVFMNFGILGALGAWVVQTGAFSWIPVFWAIPMALLVIAILHANNWRDIPSDKNGGIFTMASMFGDKGSLVYYGVLIFFPFAIILVYITIPAIADTFLPPMPLTFLLTLLAVPMGIKLLNKARARKQPAQPLDFIALDGATAQYNLVFGLLCVGSLLLHLIVKS